MAVGVEKMTEFTFLKMTNFLLPKALPGFC
jgi:hypothetical protein